MIEELPLLVNGKVDRQELLRLYEAKSQGVCIVCGEEDKIRSKELVQWRYGHIISDSKLYVETNTPNSLFTIL